MINELESCCSVIELSDLYNNTMTQKEFIDYIVTFLYENYHNYDSINERATCLIATTTDNQSHMNTILLNNKFKRIKFYGRHQKDSVSSTGKRNKYMNFWIKTSLPTGVIPKLRTMLRNNHDHW